MASDRPLSALAGFSPVSVADRIALADAGLRKFVVTVVVVAFLAVNGIVLLGIWLAYLKDVDLLAAAGSNFKPSDRLVTTNLVMTIVGATTVQLGGLIVLIGKYLFPASKQ